MALRHRAFCVDFKKEDILTSGSINVFLTGYF